MLKIFLKKIAQTIDVRDEDFSDAVRAHLFEYGVRQSLADSYASGTDQDERVALMEKRLENLYAGNLRAARVTDTVSQEARKMAFAAWRKKDGKAATVETIKTADFKNWFEKYTSHPTIVAEAERRAAQNAELPDVEID